MSTKQAIQANYSNLTQSYLDDAYREFGERQAVRLARMIIKDRHKGISRLISFARAKGAIAWLKR